MHDGFLHVLHLASEAMKPKQPPLRQDPVHGAGPLELALCQVHDATFAHEGGGAWKRFFSL